jgi:hypothetical protein
MPACRFKSDRDALASKPYKQAYKKPKAAKRDISTGDAELDKFLKESIGATQKEWEASLPKPWTAPGGKTFQLEMNTGKILFV